MRIQIAESNRPRRIKQKSHTSRVSHNFVGLSLGAKQVMNINKIPSEINTFVLSVASCEKKNSEEVSHKGTKGTKSDK